MTTLQDVLDAAEALWPTRLAEDWDNPGLAVGDPAWPVSRVRLALDVTSETLDEAVADGAQVLFTHHPALFHPLRSLDARSAPARVPLRAARAGVALLSAHTNADAAPGGVNAVLADLIGLADQRPLVPIPGEPDAGIGRLGTLPAGATLGGLAARIARVLPSTASQVRVSGDPALPVRTVAVCSGAGDSLLTLPQVLAADVYVTADLRHHVSLDARAAGLGGLINVSHWASEWLWLPVAARQLAARLEADGHPVAVSVSDTRTDPWDFAIAQ